LSAQAVAAWVLAFGVLGAHSVIENDRTRVRASMLGYTFLGAMQVLMLVRFPDDVQWDRPSAWIYLAFLASCFVLGAYGLVSESQGSAARERHPGRSGDPGAQGA
jgi:hypothetical protein